MLRVMSLGCAGRSSPGPPAHAYVMTVTLYLSKSLGKLTLGLVEPAETSTVGSERPRAAGRQAPWSEGVVLRARQSSQPRHRQAVLEHMYHFYLWKHHPALQSLIPR